MEMEEVKRGEDGEGEAEEGRPAQELESAVEYSLQVDDRDC